MENLIEKRDELIRQISFLTQRDSELTIACKEKGQLLAQITADIDKANAKKKELLQTWNETLAEIRDAEAVLTSLIDIVD